MSTLLVVNCGSSSLKLSVFEQSSLKRLCDVFVTGINGSEATLTLNHEGTQQSSTHPAPLSIASAFEFAMASMPPALQQPAAIGHRVVHGGERFTASVRIQPDVIDYLESISPMAPLHNPICLEGIRACIARFGSSVPQTAVFDTAYYRQMPDKAKYYAMDAALAKKHQIQRYGFHGISHAFMEHSYQRVAMRATPKAKLITLHLGNGCSATAISAGCAIDTSMGFTPLEGLVMATRSGDIDPSVVSWLCEKEQVTPSTVVDWLNTRSGLRGVSSSSSDMKSLLEQEQTDPAVSLAIEMFCYRIQKVIGAYLVALGGLDAILFSGGIGENAPLIRERIFSPLSWLGITLDPEANTQAIGFSPGDIRRISTFDSQCDVFVVGADENCMIAENI